ncbi:retron St85 family RNA-directed DNA polymerase [Photobacterium kishitanii]|uniref:retron St85 family RNA-directed DNA polymerase n=1 Tax=Photobacterium kishitanii TaxID=318456 RepID=UPI000D17A461|nr:retron St85 family RNA-directed DNA polymerase [Photobacterium kishitanii]PSV25490.1 RNA-directed DNA polymerase [Photobacterium kishitanii]
MDLKELHLLQYVISKNMHTVSLLDDHPSLHYKVYKIPKKNIGFRTIAQPTAPLKKMQRDIVEYMTPRVCIHKNAMAYIEGVGIKNNALAHAKSTYLLKVDLENFFNSITPEMLFHSLKNQGFKINSIDWAYLKELLFWNIAKKKNKGKLVLSVGAPSSPLISNIIMYNFDVRMTSLCEKQNINYTRYADDLTFSTKDKNILFEHLKIIRKVLDNEFKGELVLNESKTIFSSKGHNRHVTGITLTNNNKISIGREKKRYISSLIHKFKYQKLNEDDIYHLQGLLSFASHIEKDFIYRMSKKYGIDTIKKIKLFSGDKNDQ